MNGPAIRNHDIVGVLKLIFCLEAPAHRIIDPLLQIISDYAESDETMDCYLFVQAQGTKNYYPTRSKLCSDWASSNRYLRKMCREFGLDSKHRYVKTLSEADDDFCAQLDHYAYIVEAIPNGEFDDNNILAAHHIKIQPPTLKYPSGRTWLANKIHHLAVGSNA